MARLRLAALFVLSVVLASCGGSEPEPSGAVFVFRLHGFPESQEFRARTQSPTVIAQARQQLQRPVAERRLFPIGPISSGNGGYNLAWRWHYTDFTLVEVAIELCDGTPALVEQDLPYWLNTVKSFCPWAGYVHAEIQ